MTLICIRISFPQTPITRREPSLAPEMSAEPRRNVIECDLCTYNSALTRLDMTGETAALMGYPDEELRVGTMHTVRRLAIYNLNGHIQ